MLKNVRVENEGIDWNADEHLFWKHEVKRKASLTILLSGHCRFEANDVTFYGDQTIEVPEGMHMTVSQNGKELLFETVPINSQESFWSYDIGFDETIDLTR